MGDATLAGSHDGATIATAGRVRALALADPPEPVLSIHLRTDPRDPANTNHAPGWLIALRNGLRDVAAGADAHATRAHRMALRELAPQAEADLLALTPAQRGRGLSYFAWSDGSATQLFSHQLAPRGDVIRWDARPFISPLVDLASRGRPTGLILVGADKVRLLHWEAGRVLEPERSVYELELGDWRRYAGYATANPARGQQTASHDESFEQRVDDWRRRFIDEVAAATADRMRALGWRRLLVAGEQPLADSFVAALPADTARRVVAVADSNVLGQEPAEIAEHLEPHLAQAVAHEAQATLRRVLEAAAAGDPAAIGADAVLHGLVEHRVEHLIIDPVARFSSDGLAPAAGGAVDGAGADLFAERAIEAAIAGGAQVTTLDADDAPALRDAGAIAALLRY